MGHESPSFTLSCMLLLLLLLLFIHASVSPIGRVAAGPAGQPGKPP